MLVYSVGHAVSRERLRIFQPIDRGLATIQIRPAQGGDFRRFQAAAARLRHAGQGAYKPRAEGRIQIKNRLLIPPPKRLEGDRPGNISKRSVTAAGSDSDYRLSSSSISGSSSSSGLSSSISSSSIMTSSSTSASSSSSTYMSSSSSPSSSTKSKSSSLL